MERITGRIRFTRKQKRYLKNLRPFRGKEWEIKTNEVINIKKSIRKQLESLQNGKCAYCGLAYNETSGPEIEHIAPKGGAMYPLHPQYTFTSMNLVLSCHLCNGPARKGTTNTLFKQNINYRKCRFYIVHPYINNPNKHLGKVLNGKKIIVIAKTRKGKKSIELFGLNDEARIIGRAKQELHDAFEKNGNLESLLERILTYGKV